MLNLINMTVSTLISVFLGCLFSFCYASSSFESGDKIASDSNQAPKFTLEIRGFADRALCQKIGYSLEVYYNSSLDLGIKESNILKWKDLEWNFIGSKKRPHNKAEYAYSDINNDGDKDLLMRSNMSLRGVKNHSVTVLEGLSFEVMPVFFHRNEFLKKPVIDGRKAKGGYGLAEPIDIDVMTYDGKNYLLLSGRDSSPSKGVIIISILGSPDGGRRSGFVYSLNNICKFVKQK